MKDKLIIFDTTLRDGEQSPGASMTREEKLRIAKALERMGVNVIEAGFAIASVGDFEAVQAIARTVKESVVCSLARALDKDIDRAGEALKEANAGRIHTFIATSPIHMERKLRMSPDQVVEQAVKAVTRARGFTDDVEFSAEDAGRSEIPFLCRIFEAVIKAGATTINIPDTVGYNVPQQFGELVRRVIAGTPNADQAIFSVHCHNDLGLAAANSLAAVLNGARQVECTINGLGERAGNAALEEIVMALYVRRDWMPFHTDIQTEELFASSQMLTRLTGMTVQRNKAIVGRNAFAHEAGIHQDGILKNPLTYEIISPEAVGVPKRSLVLGKHSGRNALRVALVEIGYDPSPADLAECYKRVSALADESKNVSTRDLLAIAHQVMRKRGSETVVAAE